MLALAALQALALALFPLLTGPLFSEDVQERVLQALLRGREGLDALAALEEELSALPAPSEETVVHLQCVRVLRSVLAPDGPSFPAAELERLTPKQLKHFDASILFLVERSHLGHGTKQAGRLAERALELVGSRPAAFGLNYCRAEFARQRGDFATASSALDTLEVPADEFARFFVEVARAKLWMDLGLLDLATGHVSSARERIEGDAFRASVFDSLEIDLALLRQDFQPALERIEKAQRALQERELSPDLEGSLRANLVVGRALAELERAREERSFEALNRARSRLEEARAGPLDPAQWLLIELGRADLELLAGNASAAHAALAALDRELLEQAGDDALIVPAYRWEAREHGSESALAELGGEVLTAFESLLDGWRELTPRPNGVGMLVLSRRTQLPCAALEVELASTTGDDDRGRERALERLIDLQAMGTGIRRRAPERDFDLAEVRATLLAPQRGALVLFPAHFRSHLFLLTQTHIRHLELPSRDELARLARPVKKALGDPTAEPPPELAQLSESLLGPLESELAELRELYGVGFDLIGEVPFGTLLSSGEPLSARIACARLASLPAGVLDHNAPAPVPARFDLSLVVVPDPKCKGVAPFRFDEEQRKALLDPLPRNQLLSGPAARRSALLTRDFSDSTIMHFLVHGLYERGEEYGATLLLEPEADSTDNRLRALDVRDLKIGPLVILSACGAGQGQARLGDDVLVNLGGAFLEIGARAVILSRFPALDTDTIALMSAVHGHLAAGQAPAEALRRAVESVPRASKTKRFHASAFEVLGFGHERLTRTSPR